MIQCPTTNKSGVLDLTLQEMPLQSWGGAFRRLEEKPPVAMELNKALYKHGVFSDELVVVHGVPREGRRFVLQA